jgi:hypothetical protein
MADAKMGDVLNMMKFLLREMFATLAGATVVPPRITPVRAAECPYPPTGSVVQSPASPGDRRGFALTLTCAASAHVDRARAKRAPSAMRLERRAEQRLFVNACPGSALDLPRHGAC